MSSSSVPEIQEIRQRCYDSLGFRPCLWQIKVVQSILGGNHTMCIAGTGMGKTLTFWLPLLFKPKGSIQIIVTPLNILGKQNVESLEKAGLKGIFIGGETATYENFRDIEDLQYQVIVISPEQAVKEDGPFEALLKKAGFAAHIVSTIYDEAHCISTWGSFRPEYKEVSRLRQLLKRVPIMLASATLPELVLQDVLRAVGLSKRDFVIIQKSSDRPNVHLYVRPVRNSYSSFIDLEFLLRNWKPGDPPPPKFIVFFDNIADSVKACLHLRSLLPPEYRHKLKWFNSEMSNTFKEDETMAFTSGDSWGELATDSLGMGMDIPDVRVIVQWRATCTMSTMWQRFGRAGRNRSIRATAVLLVEKDHLDEEKARKAEKKRQTEQKKQQAQKKRAAPGSNMSNTASTNKRQRVSLVSQVSVASGVPGTVITSNASTVDQAAAVPSDSESDEDDESIPEKMRKKYTAQNRPEDKKRNTRALRELEPAVDDFVNAKSRGLNCRRTAPGVYFQNQKATDDHLACDGSSPNGCQRCGLPLCDLCCDIHNPDAFEPFNCLQQPAEKRPSKSRISTSYDMTSTDSELRAALEAWREMKTEDFFGWEALDDCGGTLAMPNDVLQRIVDCVHHGKVESIHDLKKETRWDGTERWGCEVLALIKSIEPPLPPPLTTTPLRIADSNSEPAKVVKERAPMRCGACQQVGHTRASQKCPKYHERVTAKKSGAKENINV